MIKLDSYRCDLPNHEASKVRWNSWIFGLPPCTSSVENVGIWATPLVTIDLATLLTSVMVTVLIVELTKSTPSEVNSNLK